MPTQSRPDVEALVAENDEERPSRHLPPRLDLFVRLWCLAVSLFVLRQVFWPLEQGSQYYLVVFLGVTLPLVYLCYRPRVRGADRPSLLDWVLAGITFLVALYPVLPLPQMAIGGGGYTGFLDRQGSLLVLDVVAGMVLMALVLEAARRTTGLVLPAVCLVFFLYAYYGGYLPVEWSIAHIGLNVEQIVNALYNEASGFFGVPLDVAATYIVLFTIYGAVLDRMGAGR
ncbi:MAG TPA: C4-dicarboxylate ABC transporter permease, partial [Nocardioidaceae bacterium]|nr:C4-dicarboxylate ABC transporter permease [Nocardioidaceae bacterium]